MKKLSIALLVLLNSVCLAQQINKNDLKWNEDYQVKFKCLHLGEVLPSGWIKCQMQRDLKDGFAGNLDKLTNRAGDSVFINHRSQDWDGNDWKRDPRFEEYKVMFRWWDGETEGNWRTGLVQMAYLVNDSIAMKKSSGYLNRVVANSQTDGYIGMFGPDIRYNTIGDLWSQSNILRALLAYYYLTDKEDVLKAVIRAVDQMFDAYKVFSEHFNIYDINRNGHSLASYTDIAEQLFNITGDKKYLLFIDILYKDFTKSKMLEGSKESPRESIDAKLYNLLDMNKPFMEHAAHTVEQIRTPLFLQYYFKDSIKYVWAYENAMKKLARCITPSGACIGNEWIMGQIGNPNVGYEYCVMTELLTTYALALEKTGNTDIGDMIEKLVFNAAQGARLPDGKGISYISTDNRLEAKGNGKYFSPTHEERAVCCNPNAVKFMPTYVQNMWLRYFLKGREGLACMLYGPSVVSTRINGTKVTIEEITNYPIEESFVLKINPETPVVFPLYFRIPRWAKNVKINPKYGEIEKIGSDIVLTKKWKKGDVIKINFTAIVEQEVASNGEYYYKRGPLLYALPIEAESKILAIKKYSLPGFYDTEYNALDKEKAKWTYAVKSDVLNSFKYKTNVTNTSYPWDVPQVYIEGSFVTDKGEMELVTLVPFGNTILRRLTFPVTK